LENVKDGEKMAHIIPISGLVMNHLVRQWNELKTVMEIWAHLDKSPVDRPPLGGLGAQLDSPFMMRASRSVGSIQLAKERDETRSANIRLGSRTLSPSHRTSNLAVSIATGYLVKSAGNSPLQITTTAHTDSPTYNDADHPELNNPSSTNICTKIANSNTDNTLDLTDDTTNTTDTTENTTDITSGITTDNTTDNTTESTDNVNNDATDSANNFTSNTDTAIDSSDATTSDSNGDNDSDSDPNNTLTRSLDTPDFAAPRRNSNTTQIPRLSKVRLSRNFSAPAAFGTKNITLRRRAHSKKKDRTPRNVSKQHDDAGQLLNEPEADLHCPIANTAVSPRASEKRMNSLYSMINCLLDIFHDVYNRSFPVISLKLAGLFFSLSLFAKLLFGLSLVYFAIFLVLAWPVLCQAKRAADFTIFLLRKRTRTTQ